jgi:WD40 repeat protein/surface antigen Omp85-like protein
MPFRRRTVPLLALAAIVLLGCATSAHAQGFGKNKVQYESLDWSVLDTPHVRLHFYAEEESLARRLAAFAESVCVEYDGRFRLQKRHQVPILLYSTHHLFQQTNATPELLTEATGGLTELIKGRVLIPHNGSWARLAWVTRHELTHWYMLEKITRVMREHRRSQNYLGPLWFTEGLAEFCGTHWDADAEGLMRDAMLSGESRRLTRSDDITGTVLMYKEGQSFLLWLAEQKGANKVFDMLDQWYRADDFETLFRLVVGEPLAKADGEWYEAQRRHFYPAVATARVVSEAAQRLTPRGHYNLGPRVVHNTSPADTALRFCYFRASESGIDLMMSVPDPAHRGKRREQRLLRGGLTPQFESFHLFQNRPCASASGLIALTSKRGGRDALYVIDGARRRVLKRLEFPHLVAVTDPSFVPGDTGVVFTAQDYGGASDLYRATWGDGAVHLTRLTHDDYDDLEPDVSPDGQWVVFASDRGDTGGQHALFRLSLTDGRIEAVSHPGSGEDRQPVYSPDGRWIAYRSTRGGTNDLWVRAAEPSDSARRVTRLLGPASDPDWLSNSRGLLFTGQNAIQFQTYSVDFQPDTLVAEAETPPAAAPVARVYDTGAAQRYERRLGFDLVQNAVGLDPSLGGAGGGQVAVSDVLGNEQFYFSVSNDAQRFGSSFWDGLEGSATYVNQARRLNYGVGLFRLTQIYDADLNLLRLERRVGISALASYPFDKFNRVEGAVLVRHAQNHLLRHGGFADADLVSNFVSFVHDNTGWTLLGPSMGYRMIASAGFTRDLTSAQGDFGTLLGEVRRYYMPISQFVLASRVQGQVSVGRDAQRFYVGGRNSTPGWDPRTLAGLRTVVAQQELRFPLLRGVTLALPGPWQLPPVSGVAFADAAWAWDDGGIVLPSSVPGYALDATDSGPGAQGHVGSAGLGFFIGGGYYPALRWNYAWTTLDFHHFSRRPHTQFALGWNF